MAVAISEGFKNLPGSTPFAKYRKNSKKMQKSVDRRLGMWYYT
jgi:hypothetical protein